MNLRILVESLKFNKIKSSSAVKVFFVLLIAIRAFMTLAPIGNRDFQFINSLLESAINQNLNFSLPTKGNIIIMAIYFSGYFLSIFIGLLYSQIFILENENYRSDTINLNEKSIFMIPIKKAKMPEEPTKESISEFVKMTFKPSSFRRNIERDKNNNIPYVKTALLDSLKKLPQLILFLLLFMILLMFSTPFFTLPFIIITSMLIFAPLNMLYAQNKFARSLELSYKQTNGAKLTMFFTYIMQNFIFNLISDSLMLVLENYYYSYLVIETFIFAIKILATARLYALFYQILALRQPYRT